MNKTFVSLFILLLLLPAENWAFAGIQQFWVLTDGDKVTDNMPPPQPTTDTVSLFGMRNEIVAFQVVLQADQNGASKVLVQLPNVGPIDNLLAPHIEVFREDFVMIKQRSADLVWQPGSDAEPEGLSGLIADRLVPLTRGVDLLPEQQQAFWIDIWIPKDAPAGQFKGTVHISECDSCNIEVSLEILDQTMAETSQARSMLWFSGGEEDDKYINVRYFDNPATTTPLEKLRLRLLHYQLARKHRVTLFWGNHDVLTVELADLLSGRAFSPERGYQGPGEHQGQDLLVLHAYGGALSKTEAIRWLEISRNYPSIKDVFGYIMDEPSRADFPTINQRVADSIPMPSFVTTPFDTTLQTTIFAAPADRYATEDARAAHKAGKAQWIYNGVRPFTGTYAIDDVGISPRVNPWIQYKLRIPRWFYWEATYYLDFQGKRGPIDIGTDALNFTNTNGDAINGDGLLMYPGRDKLFPKSDAGFDGPLASVRLKNWRRGIQDVEYLHMAKAAGHEDEVNAILNTLLPEVVDQADPGDAVSWPEDGHRWQLARRRLFELLRDGSSDISLQEIGRPNSGGTTLYWLLVAALAFLFLLLVRGLVMRTFYGKSVIVPH